MKSLLFIEKHTTIDNGGYLSLYWNFLMCFIMSYYIVFLPIRFAFPFVQERFPEFILLDNIADIYYFIDFFVNLRTNFLEKGCKVNNSLRIFSNSIRYKYFYFDLLSILPLNLLILQESNFAYYNYLIICIRFLRFFKLYKIIIFIDRIEARSDHPNLIRICSLIVLLAIIIHINACIYYFISTWIGYGRSIWTYPGFIENIYYNNLSVKLIFPSNNVIDQYLHCLHWSSQMLTTIGEVNPPTQFIEYIYSIILLLSGVLIFATLVGNVGTILTNLNAARAKFESRLDNIKQYMHNRDIRDDLQESVLRWFDHLWERSKGIDEQETLHNLPYKLRAQIAFYANKSILSENPIFKESEGDEGFKIDLVLQLKSELFPPNEIIYKRNQIGSEMYIIRNGKVSLTDRKCTNDEIISNGSYLGLNCVLNFNEHGCQRSETARTIGFCDLLVLQKKDLIELLVDYPHIKTKLYQTYKCEILREKDSQNQFNISELDKKIKLLFKNYEKISNEYMDLFQEHRRLLEQVYESKK